MRFDKAKCNVLHGGIKDILNISEWMGNRPADKDVGVLVDEKLDKSWQTTSVSQKSNCILGCNKRGEASSALVWPHLEYYIQTWGLQYKKDVGLLEWT